ncbi:MAG TPA: hypothetical protein VI685_01135 [Candidatus Angelobacter sp.]
MFNRQLTPKRREKAERIVAQGMQSFALRRGVLVFGVLSFVLFTAWMYLDPLRRLSNRVPLIERGNLPGLVMVALPMWLVLGYGWGVWVWMHHKRLLARQNH